MIHVPDSAEWLKKYMASETEKRVACQMPVFGVAHQLNIPYLEDDNPAHRLDVYRPKNVDRTLPVIFMVHGGAWIAGSHADLRNFGMYLASKGFAVVNASYSPAVDGSIRTQVDDLIYCLHWMLKSSRTYGLDMNNVFLCAESSGALLSMLAYLVNASDTLRLLYKTLYADVGIRGIGLLSPVTNLHIFTELKLPSAVSLTKKLFGETPTSSPYYYCASLQDALRKSAYVPPVFLLGSVEDSFYGQTLWTDHLLNKREVEHTFRCFPKGEHHRLDHAFSARHPDYAESMRANDEMIAFFKTKIQ